MTKLYFAPEEEPRAIFRSEDTGETWRDRMAHGPRDTFDGWRALAPFECGLAGGLSD
jgi:hypothetical protein